MDALSERYLRTPAAAEYLGVSQSFLEKRRISGDGPEFICLGKSVVYEKGALDDFAFRGRRHSTSGTKMTRTQRSTPRSSSPRDE